LSSASHRPTDLRVELRCSLSPSPFFRRVSRGVLSCLNLIFSVSSERQGPGFATDVALLTRFSLPPPQRHIPPTIDSSGPSPPFFPLTRLALRCSLPHHRSTPFFEFLFLPLWNFFGRCVFTPLWLDIPGVFPGILFLVNPLVLKARHRSIFSGLFLPWYRLPKPPLLVGTFSHSSLLLMFVFGYFKV